MPPDSLALLERFYRDLLYELGEHAQRGGTAVGAAVTARRVARGYGLSVAERLPLPRLDRRPRCPTGGSNRGCLSEPTGA